MGGGVTFCEKSITRFEIMWLEYNFQFTCHWLNDIKMKETETEIFVSKKGRREKGKKGTEGGREGERERERTYGREASNNTSRWIKDGYVGQPSQVVLSTVRTPISRLHVYLQALDKDSMNARNSQVGIRERKSQRENRKMRRSANWRDGVYLAKDKR